MKANKDFEIVLDSNMLGFETEHVYKITCLMTGAKIGNINIQKDGNVFITSVCCAEINKLIKALQYANKVIKS